MLAEAWRFFERMRRQPLLAVRQMTTHTNDVPPRRDPSLPSSRAADRTDGIRASRPVSDGSQLARISPSEAFWLFAIALAVGVVAVVLEEGFAWQSPLAIMWYSGVLLVAQRRYRVPLGGGVQDSPYFLGFILTLVGLVKIFATIAATEIGKVDLGSVVGQAGAALIATAVGLMARQALSSFDPGEEARDQLFRTVTSGIREQAAELHELQAEFIVTARQHTGLRTAHFERETQVAASYLSALEKATGALTTSAEGYPEKVGQLLRALSAHIEELKKGARNANELLEALRATAGRLFDQEASAVRSSLTTAARELGESRSAAVAEASKVTTALTGALSDLRARSSELDEAAAAYPRAASTLNSALTGVSTTLDTTRGKLDALVTSLTDAKTKLDATRDGLGREADGLQVGVQARAEALRKELEAIDNVISDLVTVLRKRLKAAERDGLRL